MMSPLSFVLAWLADPRRVAAVAQSSPALAAVITAEITPAAAPIIELGPGTGVFTRALLDRGVAQDQLALIENGSEFLGILRTRFPDVNVLPMDADRLKEVELFDGRRAGAVISGLPLLSMPPRKVMTILDGSFRHLRTGGAFYQFTYGPRCPVSRAILDRLGLKATRIGGTLANVPPAAVYRIRERPQRRRSETPRRVRPAARETLSNLPGGSQK